jgi:alanine dehydrogenase
MTGARTGATSAIAAELLAGPNTRIAAIIGTGSVARSQLAALQAVLPVEEVRVFSRRPEHRAAFIEEVESVVRVPLVDCDSVEAAVDGASLVTLATKSPDPVLFARHLVPGMHVNSVGSARPNLSEVDPAAFPEFDRVVCDSVELVFKESGDAVSAAGQGLFSPARAVDLAEVMAEEVPRRQDDVTLFKSTGSGLQDLALSVAVLEAAAADGAGTVVDEVLALKQFGVTGRT